MTSHYYILLQDKQIEYKSVISGIANTIIGRINYALKGSLLEFNGRASTSTGAYLNRYHLAEDPSMRVKCEAHEVEHLTINEYEWLLPIQQPKDRYEFYNQKEKYTIVTTLVGDRVWVSVPEEDPFLSVDQSTCCSATVRYIGSVTEKQGNYFGLELEKRLGTCDGSIRGKCYFHCKDNFGIFLPANHIISKSAGTSQVLPVSVAMYPHPQKKEEKKGKLLVSSDKSSSGREFREGDRVTVYDCKDKEHIGTVKWACSGKEKGIYGYIIGIELNYCANKKQLFQDHIKGWGYYFKKQDYKNHTYLAMSEMFVRKDDDRVTLDEDLFKKDTLSVESVLKESEVARKKIEEDVQKQALLDAGGVDYFNCSRGHAMFVALDKLRPDERFSQKVHGDNPVDEAVGNQPRVVEFASAPDRESKVKKFVGQLRGIQGNQNSCYLDATLFAMFALNNYFDQMLLEEAQDEYGRNVQDIISTKIIYPLRQNTVVSYDPVMELRRALDKLGKVKGFIHMEQDPEEFLNLLFKHALRIKPFLRLHRPSGEDTEFFLQLFVEPSKKKIWTVKEMLTKSLKSEGISFTKPPLKLIIQLPIYGKDFKIFERIYPEINLDISELCRDYAPLVPDDVTCVLCGESSPSLSCSDCGSRNDPLFKQEVMYFCEDCSERVHHLEKRLNHRVKPIVYTPADNPVCKMQLMSVICIEKSHYVCFTRFEKRWFFFDSMADRTDTEFNIPEVSECPEIGHALDNIDETRKKDPSTLHPLVRRLVKDASICIYVDPEGDMFGEEDDSFNHCTDPAPGRGHDPAPGRGHDPAPGRGRDPAPGRDFDPDEFGRNLVTLDDDAKVDEDQPKLNRQLLSQNKDIIQQINSLSLELQNLKLKQESSARKQSDLQKENASLTSGIQNYVQCLTETEENTRKLEDDVHQLTLSLNQSREENKRLNDEHKKMKEEYQQDHNQFASSLEEMQKENQILRESRVEVERYLTERISLLEKQVETMQPSWNINPTKLRVTDEELGRGAYGEVKVGMYCGGHVAVKRVHQVIISDYNRDQFKREMQIVSRLRHPHLVLFIGAVTTGTLTIVTELMETSLRKQLELGRISDEHIIPISRDVACALNYLHSLPEPIIHRDVSSANVLLNSKPGGGWMAKLGDFGSANFLAQLSTVAPGCVAYAAPECQTPALQGPKMDVYSFGILLFEMFTGKLPDPDRVHLLRVAPPSGSTAKQAMTEIAKICVCQKVDDRPNMAAVYARLGQI